MTATQQALDLGTAAPTSRHKCGKCGGTGAPVNAYLWRTNTHGLALVDCPCGHKWQETHHLTPDCPCPP